MIFTSGSDIYFVTLAIYAYNVLWDIIVGSGLIYLPFAIVIISIVREVSESSKNLSDSGFMIKRLEARIYPMVIGVALVAAPITEFDLLKTAQYTKICEVDSSESIVDKVFDPDKDIIESDRLTNPVQLATKGVIVEMAGLSLKLPLLLKWVMSYSNGFAVGAVSRLPCSVNIAAVSDSFNDTKIPDAQLKVELKEFVQQCYVPAKQKASKDTSMPWIEKPFTDDQPWPGHKAFLNKDYYGNVGEGFYSKSLIPHFQAARTNSIVSQWTSSKADADAGLIDCADGNCLHQQGGFPSCYEWWSGVGAGYTGVSISNVDASLKSRLQNNLQTHNAEAAKSLESVIGKFIPILASGEVSDHALMLSYFNQNIMQQVNNVDTKDYAFDSESSFLMGALSRFIGTYGNFSASLGNFSGASMIQLAAPIAKGMALFVIIALLPLSLIASKFDFKYIVPMHFFIGSVMMWPFCWELAILAQQSYIEQVMEQGEIGIIDFFKDPNAKLLSQYMTDALFLAFPSILTAMLTAAGVTVGAHLSNLSTGAEAGSPARQAGNAALGAAKGAVSSGAKTLASSVTKSPAGAAASQAAKSATKK